MKKQKKSSGILAFFLCFFIGIVAVCAVLLGLFEFQLMSVDSKKNERIERFEVPSGESVRSIASKLAEKKLIKSQSAFYFASRFPLLIFSDHVPVMKSGVYEVSSAMSAREIIFLLESGKQEYIKTVIPEGLTLKKIAEALEEKGVCSKDDFFNEAHNPNNLEKYQIPSTDFQGFLFPDTYNFTPKMEAKKVLFMMADNFFAHISKIPELKGKSPAEFYPVLILASIVEREYRSADEAPLIASVFLNRISDGSGLYSCATIEYIITEIQGKPHPDVITYDDLKINSPYNTYKWAGLPPGPISNPGMVALKAAAEPAKTDYRFFVLKGDGSGKHNFSRTFSEHERGIISYRTKKAAGAK